MISSFYNFTIRQFCYKNNFTIKTILPNIILVKRREWVGWKMTSHRGGGLAKVTEDDGWGRGLKTLNFR